MQFRSRYSILPLLLRVCYRQLSCRGHRLSLASTQGRHYQRKDPDREPELAALNLSFIERKQHVTEID